MTSANLCRDSTLGLWRTYDFPRIIVMYFSMYRIACDYPALKMKLDRATYLKRAYATALGMFNPPRQTWATVARFGAHRPSLRTIQSLGASASVVRCAPRMRPCTSSPNDGVRRRLHLRTAGQQIDFELTGARFAKEEPRPPAVVRCGFWARIYLNTVTKSFVVRRQKIRPDGTEPLRLRIPAGSSRVVVEIIRS
jgi:Family of unknown function (DUF5695)